MVDQNDSSPACACHMMEILAETSSCPVSFDRDRGAYFLRNSVTFRYCPSCGGRLPEPTYRDAIEPDPDDRREAIAAVESVASLDELVNVLGKPDELVSARDSDSDGFMAALYRVLERYPETYDNDPNNRWTRYAKYGSKWPTLCLDVYEYPDGRLEPCVTGLGPNEFVIVERRRWWSRYLPRLTRTT